MYRFRHRDAVLKRLENHGRRETVQLASYTVDHIMPQGERLLARHLRIRVRLQDRVDDAGEPVQLRPPDRLRPAVARRPPRSSGSL